MQQTKEEEEEKMALHYSTTLHCCPRLTEAINSARVTFLEFIKVDVHHFQCILAVDGCHCLLRTPAVKAVTTK